MILTSFTFVRTLFTFLVIAALCAPAAYAAEGEEEDIVSEGKVMECGTPASFDSPDVMVALDPKADYCDIFARQLAYRTESMKLTERLNQRRAYNAQPHREALKNYREALESLNEERAQSAREKNEGTTPAARIASVKAGQDDVSSGSPGATASHSAPATESGAPEPGPVKTAVIQAVLKSVSE